MPLQIPLPTADPYTDIAQYVPLLISSIEGFLQAHDVWDPADYQQAYSYMEDLKAYLVDTLPSVNDAFSTYATHWHIGSKVNAGAAIGIVMDTGQIGAHVARQNSPALLDETQFEIPLKAGNYTLDLIYRKQSSAAIIDLTIQGVTTISTDLYAGATTNNIVLSTNFTVATNIRQLFKTRATGKNASSSGYTVPISCFIIKAR